MYREIPAQTGSNRSQPQSAAQQKKWPVDGGAKRAQSAESTQPKPIPQQKAAPPPPQSDATSNQSAGEGSRPKRKRNRSRSKNRTVANENNPVESNTPSQPSTQLKPQPTKAPDDEHELRLR